MTGAVEYCRVSTGRQAEVGRGLDTQQHSNRAYAAAHGLVIGKTYTDTLSGRRNDRPALKKLLQDAAMHQFKDVVVFELSRLTRGGISPMVRTIDQLLNYGVRIHSVSESWWTSDNEASKLIMVALAYAGKMESDHISSRVKAAVKRKRDEATAEHPFVWGAGSRALLRTRPELPAQVAALRAESKPWASIATALGISVSSAKRLARMGLLAQPHAPQAEVPE